MDRAEALKNQRERLINDPAFESVISDFQRFKMLQISSYESDGSEQANNVLLEWCRQLKTITDLKRHMKNDLAKLSERDSQ